MVGLKRVDRIAKALSLLQNENICKLKWTHIGDGETMQQVKEICEEKLGFMEVNLMGRVPNSDVRDFYKKEKVDILLNVSTTEGLPVSMMEALSYSIPVIATKVGGVGEIIRDGYNGNLISPDFTDEELAVKIKEFISYSNEEKLKMRENARSFWAENFDAEKNFSEFAREISGIDR
jgi:glycosyltransferase involved in cell wall biosynthesis